MSSVKFDGVYVLRTRLNNKVSLFVSIRKSILTNTLLGFSIIVGYALALLGSAISAWEFRAGLRWIWKIVV
jgi:hypothetical protein